MIHSVLIQNDDDCQYHVGDEIGIRNLARGKFSARAEK